MPLMVNDTDNKDLKASSPAKTNPFVAKYKGKDVYIVR